MCESPGTWFLSNKSKGNSIDDSSFMEVSEVGIRRNAQVPH